jgi:hypothetical protein
MRTIHDDFDFACFRVTLFLTILFTNITESSFLRGDHHLWFILMLALWTVPAGAIAGGAGPAHVTAIEESPLTGLPEEVTTGGRAEDSGAEGAEVGR